MNIDTSSPRFLSHLAFWMSACLVGVFALLATWLWQPNDHLLSAIVDTATAMIGVLGFLGLFVWFMPFSLRMSAGVALNLLPTLLAFCSVWLEQWWQRMDSPWR